MPLRASSRPKKHVGLLIKGIKRLSAIPLPQQFQDCFWQSSMTTETFGGVIDCAPVRPTQPTHNLRHSCTRRFHTGHSGTEQELPKPRSAKACAVRPIHYTRRPCLEVRLG